MRGVPEELKESLSRQVSKHLLNREEASEDASSVARNVDGETKCEASQDSPPAEMGKDSEPLLDHPYDILTRSRVDLEGYVLLLQVIQTIPQLEVREKVVLLWSVWKVVLKQHF